MYIYTAVAGRGPSLSLSLSIHWVIYSTAAAAPPPKGPQLVKKKEKPCLAQ